MRSKGCEAQSCEPSTKRDVERMDLFRSVVWGELKRHLYKDSVPNALLSDKSPVAGVAPESALIAQAAVRTARRWFATFANSSSSLLCTSSHVRAVVR